ncbi:hypothetical protein [Phytomonospora endophytica]|uniref:Uncharacterized protein n=1 Tax=Phytomonospora endophytica TaxID=714109 RepID=A0A841FK83_9ACTN|nr:hypothetical protein [Phytomonospora endophytica]MBB6036284.1 hypothetical protein [Phytomonospora endophytica]GIG67191.1 hypothetical protein Pen01_34860 [Phytomonospora endophytica]
MRNDATENLHNDEPTREQQKKQPASAKKTDAVGRPSTEDKKAADTAKKTPAETASMTPSFSDSAKTKPATASNEAGGSAMSPREPEVYSRTPVPTDRPADADLPDGDKASTGAPDHADRPAATEHIPSSGKADADSTSTTPSKTEPHKSSAPVKTEATKSPVPAKTEADKSPAPVKTEADKGPTPTKDSDLTTPAAGRAEAELKTPAPTKADSDLKAPASSRHDGPVTADPAHQENAAPARAFGRAEVTDPGEQNSLLPKGSRDDLRERWQALQMRFVDDPRTAANDAGALVEESLGRLRTALDDRKRELDGWDSGNGTTDTERLRLAVRNYRELLDNVLGH